MAHLFIEPPQSEQRIVRKPERVKPGQQPTTCIHPWKAQLNADKNLRHQYHLALPVVLPFEAKPTNDIQQAHLPLASLVPRAEVFKPHPL